jgi:hypothetical protein
LVLCIFSRGVSERRRPQCCTVEPSTHEREPEVRNWRRPYTKAGRSRDTVIFSVGQAKRRFGPLPGAFTHFCTGDHFGRKKVAPPKMSSQAGTFTIFPVQTQLNMQGRTAYPHNLSIRAVPRYLLYMSERCEENHFFVGAKASCEARASEIQG